MSVNFGMSFDKPLVKRSARLGNTLWGTLMGVRIDNSNSSHEQYIKVGVLLKEAGDGGDGHVDVKGHG
jgi:hypothetical protein